MADTEGVVARWLLLLPRPPSEISFHSMQVAYGPGLTKALQDASRVTTETSKRTLLDVGVAYGNQSKSEFAGLQKLFATLYKMTCIICTEHSIDLQFENDVDGRFFLFGSPGNRSASGLQGTNTPDLPSLQQVAQCCRSWSRLCALESEVGEDLLRDFLRFREERAAHAIPNPAISRLPGGLSMMVTNDPSTMSDASPNSARRCHRSVAVGGTFDHLHAGHKLLLTMTAFALGVAVKPGTKNETYLTIGITGDELLKEKQYIEELEDWDQRQTSVKGFLLDFLELTSPIHVLQETQHHIESVSRGREIIDVFHSGLHVRYIEIFDPYGPTISDPDISALVISAETRAGGEAVNNKRQEKNWPPLEVLEVDVLDAVSDGSQGKDTEVGNNFRNKLSSTEIRSRIHQRRPLVS